jgi:hypothetical protein
MRPASEDGVSLEAEFRVEDLGGTSTVVLESRSGRTRNPDYHLALSVLLTRLRAMDARILLAIVDSTVSRRHPFEERVMQVRERPYPIVLSRESDIEALRIALESAQGPVAQEPGAKGGNRHKRIRLYLDGVDADDLEGRLGGVPESGPLRDAVEMLELSRIAPRRGGGQGRGLDAVQRGAVEDRAMRVVMLRLEGEGWEVSDVSREYVGYDLLAMRGNEQMHVEVKGTTGEGLSVLLTKNEVRHARHDGRAVLAVVSGIRLVRAGEDWSGEHGTETVFRPWRPDQGRLTALVYEWDPGKQA